MEALFGDSILLLLLYSSGVRIARSASLQLQFESRNGKESC